MADKHELHQRNRHRDQYDFELLTTAYPALAEFVACNKYGNLSIDFFDATAVKALNKALLISSYGVGEWDIPDGYLCPPIPGRADYVHYIADLLGDTGRNAGVRCLDIGVGANCIYPIVGSVEYGWGFVGSDIDPVAIDNARAIVAANSVLRDCVELRLQNDQSSVFSGVIGDGEWFDVSMCNPPFHGSKDEADRGTLRKLSNLKGRRVTCAALNFGGRSNELWCSGGELRFLQDMIEESREFRSNVGWFTTLVSKEDNLSHLRQKLRGVGVAEHCKIDMQQGNKISRILAWRYNK